jgi:hypothetical protein
MLQERMQLQKEEDEAVPKVGGARWKSARSNKGSILSYAKDVQDKHKKKYGDGDPVLKALADTRKPNKVVESGEKSDKGLLKCVPVSILLSKDNNLFTSCGEMGCG